MSGESAPRPQHASTTDSSCMPRNAGIDGLLSVQRPRRKRRTRTRTRTIATSRLQFHMDMGKLALQFGEPLVVSEVGLASAQSFCEMCLRATYSLGYIAPRVPCMRR